MLLKSLTGTDENAIFGVLEPDQSTQHAKGANMDKAATSKILRVIKPNLNIDDPKSIRLGHFRRRRIGLSRFS